MTAHRMTTVSVNGGPPEPIETAVARVLHALQDRAEKAERALDEERRQRIHEAELAREAIAHVRALLPPPDDIELPADVAARAWLEKVRV